MASRSGGSGGLDLVQRWCRLERHGPSLAEAARASGSAEGSKGVSLHDCLRLYTESERLSGNEQAFCSRCKAHCDCDREELVAKAPKYCVIALKRFSHDGVNADRLQRMMGGKWHSGTLALWVGILQGHSPPLPVPPYVSRVRGLPNPPAAGTPLCPPRSCQLACVPASY